jgi:hypothetical protein
MPKRLEQGYSFGLNESGFSFAIFSWLGHCLLAIRVLKNTVIPTFPSRCRGSVDLILPRNAPIITNNHPHFKVRRYFLTFLLAWQFSKTKCLAQRKKEEWSIRKPHPISAISSCGLLKAASSAEISLDHDGISGFTSTDSHVVRGQF